MDAKQLLDLLTIEDITDLLISLGSVPPIPDANGNLYFTTVCHHGHSSKLLLYTDTKQCYCFTSCGSLSIFDVVAGHLGVNFKEAFNYICQFKGVSTHSHGHLGFGKVKIENTDFAFLNQVSAPVKDNRVKLPEYHKGILNLFYDLYPKSWAEEGITPEVAQKFDIKYCFQRQAAIIPYLDIQGRLIGIRQRNFKEYEVKAGRKYIPLQAEGTCYRYPSSCTFFGIYENQANIRKYKRAILFESEKSTMLMSSLFGVDKDISLALGGMNISHIQRQLLMDLGVETVVLALDKENTNDINSKETKAYLKKLRKLVRLLIPYVQVDLVLCWDDRLPMKASPIDQGKEVFKQLLSERYTLTDLSEFEQLLND